MFPSPCPVGSMWTILFTLSFYVRNAFNETFIHPHFFPECWFRKNDKPRENKYKFCPRSQGPDDHDHPKSNRIFIETKEYLWPHTLQKSIYAKYSTQSKNILKSKNSRGLIKLAVRECKHRPRPPPSCLNLESKQLIKILLPVKCA